MISDQPDIKLAVLEEEYQDLVTRGHDIIGKAATSTGYSTSMNIVRWWLQQRIDALKEDVKAMKTRQAKAHSVDEALLTDDDFPLGEGC